MVKKHKKESVTTADDTLTIAPPIEQQPKITAPQGGRGCPWCISQGDAGDRLILTHKWQCKDCGKMWKDEALGRPYTLELEQGVV